MKMKSAGGSGTSHPGPLRLSSTPTILTQDGLQREGRGPRLKGPALPLGRPVARLAARMHPLKKCYPGCYPGGVHSKNAAQIRPISVALP
jgi:hypothetical protein